VKKIFFSHYSNKNVKLFSILQIIYFYIGFLVFCIFLLRIKKYDTLFIYNSVYYTFLIKFLRIKEYSMANYEKNGCLKQFKF